MGNVHHGSHHNNHRVGMDSDSDSDDMGVDDDDEDGAGVDDDKDERGFPSTVVVRDDLVELCDLQRSPKMVHLCSPKMVQAQTTICDADLRQRGSIGV